MTYTEAVPNHDNGTDTAAIEAAQNDPIQCTEDKVMDAAMTHHTSHTANHPHTAAHQNTALRTAVDHIHTHPTDHQNIIHTKKDHTVGDHTPIRNPENHTLVGIGRSIEKSLHQVTTVWMNNSTDPGEE